MDTSTILSGQISRIHGIAEQALDGLTDEQLHHLPEGGTIQPIAAIYAHVVIGEDSFIHSILQGKPTIFEQGGWADKANLHGDDRGSLSEAATAKVREANFPALREYAQQVYAATAAYLESLSAADLDRIINVPWAGGDVPVGQFLGSVVAWHAAHHTGEICAMKGCMGGKGLPF